MNPREAAKFIGCSSYQVRWLIRNNKMEAEKIPTTSNQFGYEYQITKEEAVRVRDNKTTGSPRGPRGARSETKKCQVKNRRKKSRKKNRKQRS